MGSFRRLWEAVERPQAAGRHAAGGARVSECFFRPPPLT
jgi:hypothetical protein